MYIPHFVIISDHLTWQKSSRNSVPVLLLLWSLSYPVVLCCLYPDKHVFHTTFVLATRFSFCHNGPAPVEQPQALEISVRNQEYLLLHRGVGGRRSGERGRPMVGGDWGWRRYYELKNYGVKTKTCVRACVFSLTTGWQVGNGVRACVRVCVCVCVIELRKLASYVTISRTGPTTTALWSHRFDYWMTGGEQGPQICCALWSTKCVSLCVRLAACVRAFGGVCVCVCVLVCVRECVCVCVRARVRARQCACCAIVVRSNDSFNFPLGWIKYIVILMCVRMCVCEAGVSVSVRAHALVRVSVAMMLSHLSVRASHSQAMPGLTVWIWSLPAPDSRLTEWTRDHWQRHQPVMSETD